MFYRAQNKAPIRDYHNLLCRAVLVAVLLAICVKLEVGRCQLVSGSSNVTSSTTMASLTPNSSDKDEAGELILSSDEFVDARERPLILIDAANIDEEPPTTLKNSTKQANVVTNATSSSSYNSSHPAAELIGDNFKRNELNETATTTTNNQTRSSSPSTTELGRDQTDNNGERLDEASDDDDDDSEPTDEPKGPSSQGDTAPNPLDANQTFEPPQSIPQYMDYIEKLFHDLRHQIAQLFEPHLPQLIRTSQMVELSSSCSYDMLRMALALRQFEPWALRMIDSSGKVPEGIFEGSFTALGSYDECLGTVFQSSFQGDSSQQQQQAANSAPLTQGQYCLVTVSPFMPPKPPADKVERLFQDEANRRNYTRDDQFSRLSPMFYYMKFRIGVCIPSSCDQDDMSSISSALSSSLRLNITIPDCRIKQAERRLTEPQFIGGLLFGSVLVLVLAATMVDCFKLKWKQLENQDLEFLQQSFEHNDQQQRHHPTRATATDVIKLGLTDQLASTTTCDLVGTSPMNAHSDQCDEAAESRTRFVQRLAKHWTWMSFSLLANFRLYFDAAATASTSRGVAAHQSGVRRWPQLTEAATTGATCLIDPTPANYRRQEQTAQHHQTIACLNGIRVLSLCWIIVANSYLTLDPRATKRLTKTREAPRDFLFQLVTQASLAIETFFFLSGLLMSLSFARHLRPLGDGAEPKSTDCPSRATTTAISLLKWLQFYVHRYVRMTPPTMLVIAFSMYAYHFGDGPLWFEATSRVHQSCSQNWWRHLLHVANFIDTRQMCFIHYWYIAADMQLFLAGPIIMWLLYRCRRLGYLLMSSLGVVSMALVFYITYTRQLPPTLLFYSTDPESRREFGNTIMTKPFTHALPYLVGMLVGWLCVIRQGPVSGDHGNNNEDRRELKSDGAAASSLLSATGLFGSLAVLVALVELFLPYKWNNSHLPGPLPASIYAALFRLGWSLVLAYVVISCGHPASGKCEATGQSRRASLCYSGRRFRCYCASGGNYLNKLLGLGIFNHLSKLSFVAYLVHLPLMSAFIGQTRGLFAFSHALVLHFAISYLVISFAVALILVHFIEFPFITFERLMFEGLFKYLDRRRRLLEHEESKQQQHQHQPKTNILAAVVASEKYLFHGHPRSRPTSIRSRMVLQHGHCTNSPLSGRGVAGCDLALTLEQTTSAKANNIRTNNESDLQMGDSTRNGGQDFRHQQQQRQRHVTSERL